MPLHSTTIRDRDRFERTTILADLRLLQAAPVPSAEIEAVVSDCGGVVPLDDAAIDALCERIHVASVDLWRDVAGPSREPREDDVGERDREDEAYEMQMQDCDWFSEGVW